MIGFCAAHLSDSESQARLHCMIDSWLAQRGTSVPLYLSLSGEPFISGSVRARAAEAGIKLVVRHRGKFLSQLEHYARLAEDLGAPDGTAADAVAATDAGTESTVANDDPWVVFTDPDDICHSARLLEAASMAASSSDAWALCWRRFAEEPAAAVVTPQTPQDPPTTAADVDAKISQGLAVIRRGTIGQLWARSIRLTTLCKFIGASSPELLRNPFADLFLVSWIDQRPGAQLANSNAAWSYYRRQCRARSRAAGADWLLSVTEGATAREQLSTLSAAEQKTVAGLVHSVYMIGTWLDMVDRTALERMLSMRLSAERIAEVARPHYELVEQLFRDEYMTRIGWTASVRLT